MMDNAPQMPKPAEHTAMELMLEALADRIAAQVEQHLGASLAALVEARPSGLGGAHIDTPRASDYVEPGPHSPRKWFEPKELARRWGWGETKVYEIPEQELPNWKKGQLKRYFWAHVWAYEGRLSWDQAEEIYAFQAQAVEVLPDTPAKLTRIR